MPKTSREVLIEECRNELQTHLKSGTINTRKLSYNLSNLKVDDFDYLKKTHFVLWQDVADFAQEIDSELRQINTETKKEEIKTRGEIRGSIDWSQTFKTRYSQNYKDRSVFVCKNPYVEYDTSENLVLKKVLGIIYSTIEEFESADYSDETGKKEDRWPDHLIESFRRLYNTNVYIDRIKKYEEIKLTQRDLEAARNSRKEIYREAFRLYRAYEKLMENDLDDEEVQEILDNTLIEPQYTYTLFELYAVFGLIRDWRGEYEDLKLQPIKPGEGGNPMAVLEGSGKKIEIYHDATSEDLKFYQDKPESNEVEGEDEGSRFLRRFIKVLERHEDLLEEFVAESEDESLYSGRPDIILLEKEQGKLNRVVIGEVKYTASKKTFSQGLKELLEYIEFGREVSSNQYLSDSDRLELSGLIITDDMGGQNREVQEIEWLKSEDLKSCF